MERLTRPALAAALDLEPHPEGGWFRRTWASEVSVPAADGGTRSSATAIYYVLGPGEQSVWHQVRSAELWLHHAGVPLRLRIGGTGEAPGAEITEVLLGSDVVGGQQPQVLVAASAWQSAEPAADGEALVSCVVSPGFDFADWRTLPSG
ncbi:cupin domain-containing protein [uncultured Friedmanniella sp.]|uniref:cupin domain-containing protein n=1 Tax=uncultured Friedmanniella sp. TaxID=335381 RepID=UPI0035C98DFA